MVYYILLSLISEEGKKKLLKLYYSSVQPSNVQPESSEALAVWKRLLNEGGEGHTTKQIHDALLIGLFK